MDVAHDRWRSLPPDVLCPSVWRDLRQVEALGNPGFIAHLVDLFLRDTAERLARLRSAVDAGDVHAAIREARALRRSAHHMGALDMSGLAGAVEMVGNEGYLRYADLLLTRLEQEFALVRGALARS